MMRADEESISVQLGRAFQYIRFVSGKNCGVEKVLRT